MTARPCFVIGCFVIGSLLATGCGGTQWPDTAAAPTTVAPGTPVTIVTIPSGWVGYRDASGLTLQHPPEWTTQPSQLGPFYVFIDSRADSGGFRRNINVFAQPLPPGTTASEYLRISVQQIETANGAIEENSATQLSGLGAHEVVWRVRSGNVALRFLSVWTVRGRTAYIVTYTSDPGNFQSALADVRRVIGTIHLPAA
jgi:hypothetical protein